MKTEALVLCTAMDFWTSIAKQGWVAIYGQYLTKDFELKGVCLDYQCINGSHTAKVVAELLEVLVYVF